MDKKLITEMVEDTFSGQGSIMLRPLWVPNADFWHVGNASDASLSQKLTKKAREESQTGQRQTVGHRITKREGELSLKIDSFKRNLGLITHSNPQNLDEGTVTDELITGPRPAGAIVTLKHPFVSEVQIKDSSAQPVTLVEGQHFQHSTLGSVRLLNVANLTWPLKVAYKHGALTSTGIMSAGVREYEVRLELVNADNDNDLVLIELWRVSSEPIDKLQLIADDSTPFELKLPLLADLSKPTNDKFGQLGKITLPQLQ